jgi:hypothetical protein
MRDNSYDRTIERNYLQKWRFLIPEYEAVKAGRSKLFARVGDFYRHHGTCSQTFASITIAICRAERKLTCCRAGADPNGGNGAGRKGSRRRSSPIASGG